MKKVLKHVMLSTDEDLPRFCAAIEDGISKHEVGNFPDFNRSKASLDKNKGKRKNKAQKEAAEAEKALEELILKRQKQRNDESAVGFANFDLEKLAQKHQRKFGEKIEKQENFEEPPEELFEKNRKKRSESSKGKSDAMDQDEPTTTTNQKTNKRKRANQ